jgi:hypothetical protein
MTRRIELRHLMLWMIPVALIASCFASLAEHGRRASQTARASQCTANLFRVGFLLRNYHDRHGSFPPAYTVDSSGKRFQSWRTIILADEDPWFGAPYDALLPWDNPFNLHVVDNKQTELQCPNNQGESHRNTNFVALLKPGSSELGRGDPAPDAIVLVEYPNSDILWTEPRDLTLDELAKLNEGADGRGLNVWCADGRVRRMSKSELVGRFAR